MDNTGCGYHGTCRFDPEDDVVKAVCLSKRRGRRVVEPGGPDLETPFVRPSAARRRQKRNWPRTRSPKLVVDDVKCD